VAKLKRLLEDKGLLEEISRKGYELVKKKFSWDEVAKGVHDVLRGSHVCDAA